MSKCFLKITSLLLLFFCSTILQRALAQKPFQPGNMVVTVGGLIGGDGVGPNIIQEFTPAGGLVQQFTIPQLAGHTESARTPCVAPDGTLYIYNGTFNPTLSFIQPSGGGWTHLTYDGWSTVNDSTYGGIGVAGNYVYLTDMATAYNGTPNGIVQYDTVNKTFQRFASGSDFINLTVGLDGLLYAIGSWDGTGTPVTVFDPSTMNQVRFFHIAQDAYFDGLRSIAVDANGEIFVVGLSGIVYHYSASLQLVNSINLNNYDATNNIAISSNGTIAVTGYDGHIRVMDETLTSFSSFLSYSAPNQIAWDSFVQFVPPAAPPPPAALQFFNTSVSRISAGYNFSGAASLTAAAPAGGLPLTFSSSNPTAVPIDSIVTVPAGNTAIRFDIGTGTVTAPTTVTLTANYNGVSRKSSVLVVPTDLASFTVTPNPIAGGYNPTGVIQLNAPAPPGGAVIALSSTNRSAMPIDSQVTVPAGQYSVSFPIGTNVVSANQNVTLTASLYGGSITTAVTVTPIPPTVASLMIAPALITCGYNPTGTVTLSGPAPTGGALVKLTSSNKAAAVDSSVLVPAGQTTTTFPIGTSTVTTNATATITASYYGTQTASVTVVPAIVSRFTVNTSTIKGGNGITGTVWLTAAAPAGGITVALSSNNKTAVPIGTSVTVPAGKYYVTFPITTKTVTGTNTVTLTATLNGSLNATVTVTK